MSIVYSTVQHSTVQYSIASTNLDCGARWYSYIGGLNLGLCPADGESQRLCFFIHYTSRARTSTDGISARRATSSAKCTDFSKNLKIVSGHLVGKYDTMRYDTMNVRSEADG